jgi:hypothetical protein
MRWSMSLFSAVLMLVTFVVAPPAIAVDAPIGRLGDTLRVQTNGMIADVTVSSVLPSDVPPGFGDPPRPPRRNSDAPDALQNAPQGTLVSGRVFWDCYRDLVSNVVLINPRSGEHLAQRNL